jgi:hypothetical protein
LHEEKSIRPYENVKTHLNILWPLVLGR